MADGLTSIAIAAFFPHMMKKVVRTERHALKEQWLHFLFHTLYFERRKEDMNGQIKTLVVCEQSQKYRFQGPRYRDLGDASGEEFRDECLLPWLASLEDEESAVVDFEGTVVYSPSFLEESFGGAIHADKKNKEKFKNISFLNMDPIWLEKLNKYAQKK
jgi:hypothetical protein